jgi:shikimate kinase
MKNNVALIGFMGVGKSAVGKVLAERLEKTLIEVDFLIVRKAGKSIPQIFREDGEIAFRELEIEVIKDIAKGVNQVIACGGGVVLNKINIDRLKQNSVIVWLTASPEVIAERIAYDREGRPLLQGKNTLSHIRSLLNFRKPYYKRSADFEVDTSNLEIDSIIKQIVDKLKENADFN